MKLKLLTCALLSGSIIIGLQGHCVAETTTKPTDSSAFEQAITKNIIERFNDVKKIIEANGTSKAFAELNNLGGATLQDSETATVQDADKSGADRGGPLVCVEEGKIVVSPSNPQDLGKNVETQSPVKEIIEALQKIPDGGPYITTVTVNGITYEAWGRRALDSSVEKATAEEMKTKTKYCCYISRAGA
jgi:hypothetical protein